MENLPQDKLIKAARDARFEKVFVPFMKPLYNFAFRLIMDEDEAKDLVQDTYLKAYRFFDSFEEGTNAKAWLFRILKNTFINEYRKKSKEPGKVDYEEIEAFYNSEEA
ncbi:MAG: sigma-70 family RNA polymerase sigma factor, partial [Cytophagales bacterium]|nr:sigma-70 family RNA polymerase sigma factor [Cytophagales bacterium]